MQKMTRSIEERKRRVKEAITERILPDWYDQFLNSILAADITVLATPLNEPYAVDLVTFAIDTVSHAREKVYRNDESNRVLIIPSIGTAEALAIGVTAFCTGEIHPEKLRKWDLSASDAEMVQEEINESVDQFHIVDSKPVRLSEIRSLFDEMVKQNDHPPVLVFLESINPFLPSQRETYAGWESSLWEAMNILRSISQDIETPIITTYGWPEEKNEYENCRDPIERICTEQADILAILYSLGRVEPCLYGRLSEKPSGVYPGTWHYTGKHYFLTSDSVPSDRLQNIALSVEFNGFGDPIGELIEYQPKTAKFEIPCDEDFH